MITALGKGNEIMQRTFEDLSGIAFLCKSLKTTHTHTNNHPILKQEALQGIQVIAQHSPVDKFMEMTFPRAM